MTTGEVGMVNWLVEDEVVLAHLLELEFDATELLLGIDVETNDELGPVDTTILEV